MKNKDTIFDSVKKELINESLGYVDLQLINNLESSPKADYENKFSAFLAEEAKVVEKKTTKEVEETQEHNFDYSDSSNLDNQIGQEVLNGIHFESKQNPDKDLEEIRKIVSKNLEKDSQYYMKNTAFGVDGLGYEETEVEEVSGKYKESGYSDKLKKVVKESLVNEVSNANGDIENLIKLVKSAKNPKNLPVSFGTTSVAIGGTQYDKGELVDMFNGRELGMDSMGIRKVFYNANKNAEAVADEVNASNSGIAATIEYGYGKKPILFLKKSINESLIGELDTTNEEKEETEEKPKPKKAKKAKKESVDSKLAEIDKQGQIVAMEAKLDALAEMIESKLERINMVSEDENLSELIDKAKMKELQKAVKLLEKRKTKMEKIYEKLCGKSYTKEAIIDETQNEDE